MATFTKFDPRVFLVNERKRESLSAKPAKVAKAQSFQGDPSERVHVAVAAWAKEVARLDRGRPPADVPPHRWSQFIDDCGLFLSAPWASYAVELGWRPHDLFGCDRIRPFSRIDRAGLLWFLHGHKLIALTGDTAVLETPRGARQTFYRRLSRQRTRCWPGSLMNDAHGNFQERTCAADVRMR
jgi:hypothetical protein